MAKISKVGQTDEGLKCPNCGGDAFTARRSKMKYLVGVLAPKSRVKCVTCGKVYRRG